MKEKLPHSTISLVMGIFSIITCCFNGIPGLIFGVIGLMQSNKAAALHFNDPDRYEGLGNAKAGKITSIIGLVLSAIMFGFWLYLKSHPELQAQWLEQLEEYKQQNQ